MLGHIFSTAKWRLLGILALLSDGDIRAGHVVCVDFLRVVCVVLVVLILFVVLILVLGSIVTLVRSMDSGISAWHLAVDAGVSLVSRRIVRARVLA